MQANITSRNSGQKINAMGDSLYNQYLGLYMRIKIKIQPLPEFFVINLFEKTS